MTTLVQFGGALPRCAVPFRHWWIKGLCAVGVLAMHALMISPIVLGTITPKKARKPDVQGPGASAIVATAEFLTLVLVSEPEASMSADSALAALASRGIAPDDLAVRVLSPDPNLAFDFEDSEEQEAQPAADVVGMNAQQHALLFGRYVDQITARIERAWTRPVPPVLELADYSELPGSDVDSDAFKCQVRVLQDPQGRVLETMLLSCNGTFEWQQSLVTAIQLASPFPAPPHPSVFVTALTLNFDERSNTAAISGKGSGALQTSVATLNNEQ